MQVAQVHYSPDRQIGTSINRLPTEARNHSDNLLKESLAARVNLHDFLEMAPNLNEPFAEVLDMVRGQFEQDGLEIAPIYVLEPEVFQGAIKLAGVEPNVNGIYIHGKTLVESTSQTRDLYGNGHVLGVALHESAHSTAGEQQPLVITKKAPEMVGDVALGSMIFGLTADNNRDFTKYRCSPNPTEGFWGKEGTFFEEGFADITRVRIMERMGLLPTSIRRPLGSVWPEGTRVNYMTPSKGSPVIGTDQSVNLPVGYATCVTVKADSVALMPSVPNIAAYGLSLLDKHSPGLYEQMLAARPESSQRGNPRKVVQIIDSIRPGLYKELRILPYTETGFKEGLHIILNTLSATNHLNS